jgi:hypothetical protein
MQEQERKIVDLPIQNSPPFNRYGPYQCSWFASGCVANKEKLISTWNKSDFTQFRVHYEEILEEATHLRGTTNPQEKHIQTLFYPAISQYYALCVDSWYVVYYCINHYYYIRMLFDSV